jgi:hypothetical protein
MHDHVLISRAFSRQELQALSLRGNNKFYANDHDISSVTLEEHLGSIILRKPPSSLVKCPQAELHDPRGGVLGS